MDVEINCWTLVNHVYIGASRISCIHWCITYIVVNKGKSCIHWCITYIVVNKGIVPTEGTNVTSSSKLIHLSSNTLVMRNITVESVR